MNIQRIKSDGLQGRARLLRVLAPYMSDFEYAEKAYQYKEKGDLSEAEYEYLLNVKQV